MGHPVPEVLQRRSETPGHLAPLPDASGPNPLEPDQRQTGRYFPSLDGLRALAVGYVFIHHYSAGSWPLAGVARWGWTGVQCFFVLSGFLITGILWDSRDTTDRLRTFYIRRVLRILPLYYGVWFAILLATPLLRWRWSPPYLLWFLHFGNILRFIHWPLAIAPASTDHVIAAGGFVLFTGHLWSLCVEEQFYLVWPWLVYRFTSGRSLIRLTVALICILPVIRGVVYLACRTQHPGFLEQQALYRIMPFQVDGFAWGALLALLSRAPDRLRLLRKSNWLLLLGLVSIVALLAGRRLIEGNAPSRVDSAFVSTIGFSLIDFAAFTLILALTREASWISRVFSFAPLRRLGIVSYGFYVFHDLFHGVYRETVHWIAPATTRPVLLTALIAFGCTWLLAELSFRIYEKPFLRLKQRWQPVRRGQLVA